MEVIGHKLPDAAHSLRQITQEIIKRNENLQKKLMFDF
jgi:hypothetical protein